MLDIILGTRTSWKILSVINEAPGKAITRKEIQQQTKIGNKMLTKFLPLLESQGIILNTKIGKTNHYKMNMSNEFTQKISELIKTEKTNLNNLELYTLNTLKDFTHEIINKQQENIKKIILFGSYAKRTHNQDSDIDIAIILKEKNTETDIIITEIKENIEKRYKKEIQTHTLTEKEFKQKNSLNTEILKDGIKIF